MRKAKIGFITFGHTYFDPLADKSGLIEAVKRAWSDLPFTLIPAPDIPNDVAGTVTATEFFEDQRVDGIIINAGAYGFENLTSVLALNTALPLMVWCPHQAPQALIPVSTFLSVMANLKNLDRQVFHLLGNMDSEEAKKGLIAFSRASLAAGMLRKAVLGMVGAPCPGMLDTTFSEYHVRRFVPGLLSLDSGDILEAMDAATEPEVKEAMEKVRVSFGSVSAEESHLVTAARSYVAMKKIAGAYKLDAMTVRCWPELSQKGFSGALGVSLMCDEGIICMMERDVPATATALALYYLTGQPSHIGEIDHVDNTSGEAFFVNDNSMIPSLAAAKTENEVAGGDLFIALTSGQTNGVMLKGILKPGPVTFAKLRGTPGKGNRLSMGIATGEVLPFKPKEGSLCNARVKFDLAVNDFLHSWAEKGLEHHMVINHNVVVRELRLLSEITGISAELI
jgi:L-fucose isomerase-like protein